MKYLLLPPHREGTLRAVAPEGWTPWDLARQFEERVSAPPFLLREEAALQAQAASPASLLSLLRVKTALALGSREDVSPHTQSRILGSVLMALSPPGGLSLQLDDLLLPEGSTECSADVLRAASLPSPFLADLQAALPALCEAEAWRLWVERDQELPAALWLAAHCPPGCALEVGGTFAAEHWACLQTLPPLQRARLCDAPRGLVWQVAVPGVASPWFWKAAGDLATPAGAWAGEVTLSTLLRPEALQASQCQVAIVGFCALVEQGPGSLWVLDTRGQRHSLPALTEAAAQLARAGIRVVSEWWAGAPGQSEAAHLETLRWLEQADPVARAWFHWLAGVRTFHGGRGEALSAFDGVPVRWQAPAVERDLFRSRAFEAEGSVAREALPALVQRLAVRLRDRGTLSPGRVAGAYVQLPRAAPAEGAWVRLDPDCALVSLPSNLEGQGPPTDYAVQLRTGAVFAVDARLAASLRNLQRATPVEEALHILPSAQREKAAAALSAKNLLQKVSA